ncbi:outer membrane protein assembly factor BamB [Simiduia agarivorans]|uniref:Outer membrane protein assembly factor BamB n=1 Tax=Simiduia agarivorans (strain DSM 21679 / JCM 13881 / BCRC 17597 / SA1) TaxID=1117647 RepID=K4KJH8_SIMAS|nr:outer membrane protein assembly factor BamB [Simiduia agarivorans]AFU98143.1 protein YfgL [Simiduia agarivorans SA1 = DSM 21679]
MKLYTLVLAALLLGACASTEELELEPKELEEFAESVTLDDVWSRDVGSGQDARYTRLVPAIYGDTIYAADIEGRVFALDKTNGKIRWEVALEDSVEATGFFSALWSSPKPVPVSAGIGVSSERLLLGSYKGELIALDRNNGELLWRTQLSSEILSEPAETAGVVVATTSDGKLYGLDAETGKEKWMFESVQPVLTLRGTSAPVVMGDTVLAAFDNGKIYAFEAETGLIQWEQRVAIPKGKSELERIVDIDGTPRLAGDLLYVVSYQGRLVAFAASTGRPLWGEDASSVQGPSSDYNQVYIAGAMDKVQAFSSSTGVLQWENTDLLRRELSAPMVWGSYVAVVDLDGYLHLLDRNTGAMAGREQLGAAVRGRLLVDGDLLYVLDNDGELSAWRNKPR